MITKLAGALLDFQDDLSGTIVKLLFPTIEDMPEIIKTADLRSAEETQLMPSDRFALVHAEGDEGLIRKYACVDAGSTILQAMYYAALGDFPAGMQKQAEERFIAFGEQYQVRPIVEGILFDRDKIALSFAELRKHTFSEKTKAIAAALVAAGVGAGAGGLAGNTIGRGRERAEWNGVAQGMAEMGDPAVLSRGPGANDPFAVSLADALGNLQQAGTMKQAGVASILRRTRKAVPEIPAVPSKAKKILNKAKIPVAAGAASAAIAGAVGVHHGRKKERTDWNEANAGMADSGDPAVAVREGGRNAPFTVAGRGPDGEYAPVGKFLVGKKKEREKKAQDGRIAQAVANLTEKRASDKWPMGNPGQIKQAERYYEEYGRLLHPTDRRRYTIKLAYAMNQHNMPVPPHIAKLASLDIDPMVLQYLDHRMSYLLEPEHLSVLGELKKEAAAGMPANEIAELLLRFDENTGLARLWDVHIPDPYSSTYGNMLKIAQEVADDPITSFFNNPENEARVDGVFGPGNFAAMSADPVSIYNSLPMPQKQLLDQLIVAPGAQPW